MVRSITARETVFIKATIEKTNAGRGIRSETAYHVINEFLVINEIPYQAGKYNSKSSDISSWFRIALNNISLSLYVSHTMKNREYRMNGLKTQSLSELFKTILTDRDHYVELPRIAQMAKTNTAARRIQRYWRNAISNPNMALCRKRLMREAEEFIV